MFYASITADIYLSPNVHRDNVFGYDFEPCESFSELATQMEHMIAFHECEMEVLSDGVIALDNGGLQLRLSVFNEDESLSEGETAFLVSLIKPKTTFWQHVQDFGDALKNMVKL